MHYSKCTCFFVVCHVPGTKAYCQQETVQALWNEVKLHSASNIQYKENSGELFWSMSQFNQTNIDVDKLYKAIASAICNSAGLKCS